MDSEKTDIEQFLRKLESDKQIRIVTYEVPFDKNIILHDISLESRGMDEDKVYAANEYFRSAIRRGNSIIRVYKDGNLDQTFYGRKGFEKFFDLMSEYILFNLKQLNSFDSIGFKESNEHTELHSIIFSKAKEILKDKGQVGVYKSRKANGENAQISWSNTLNAWIIASKNVSLLARDSKDLKFYKEERFGFAKLIANAWFILVSNVEKEGKLQELKTDMNGKTFIAEYCGNQDYQHLVKYDEIQLFFYAIVDNNSEITCISPKTTIEKLKYYGFKSVHFSEREVFKDFQVMNKRLLEIYQQVAESAINEEEEGSVIYLVGLNENGEETTLSLSKLKTLEYRIYRKLREKLKGLVSSKDSIKDYSATLRKFELELESLCKGFKTPAPIDYYIDVANYAFKFAQNNKENSYIIQDQYISFLSVLLYAFHNKVEELNHKYFTEERISQTMKLSWSDYYKNYQSIRKTKNLNTKLVNSTKVFVIVPIGIPGMGKTFLVDLFFNKLKDMKFKFDFDSVSSDEARKDCMEKLGRTNKKLTQEQLFERTSKEGRELFDRRLKESIVAGKNKKSDAYFIYIDKNHPPNAIPRTIQTIQENGIGLDLKIIALTPIVDHKFMLERKSKYDKYPFSLNLFFTCLDRVQKRINHPTLNGGGHKTAGVCTMFFDFFRNVSLSTESIYQNGFDIHMQMPFNVEDENFNIPSQLSDKFIEILLASKSGEMCSNDTLLNEFNILYEKSKLEIKNPGIDVIGNHLEKFLSDVIIPALENKNQQNVDSKTEETKQEETKQEEKVMIKPESKTSEGNPNNKNLSQDSSKVPVYLGIFTEKDCQDEIVAHINEGLKLLSEKYKNDNDILTEYKNFQNKKNGYKSIKDVHVTTLFLGGNKKKTESEIYQNFEEGIKMDIKISCLIIVPGKIVTGVCYIDHPRITVENQFPHVTLLQGDWAPKLSNDLMEALFSSNKPHHERWRDNGFDKLTSTTTIKQEVKIGRDKATAYVVNVIPHLVLPSVTRKYFN